MMGSWNGRKPTFYKSIRSPNGDMIAKARAAGRHPLKFDAVSIRLKQSKRTGFAPWEMQIALNT